MAKYNLNCIILFGLALEEQLNITVDELYVSEIALADAPIVPVGLYSAEHANWGKWVSVDLNTELNAILWRRADNVRTYLLTEHYRTGLVIPPIQLTFFAQPGNGAGMRAQQAAASDFFTVFYRLGKGPHHESCK